MERPKRGGMERPTLKRSICRVYRVLYVSPLCRCIPGHRSLRLYMCCIAMVNVL